MGQLDLNLLREWVLAEIEYDRASHEIGGDGYACSANTERQKAEDLFNRLGNTKAPTAVFSADHREALWWAEEDRGDKVLICAEGKFNTTIKYRLADGRTLCVGRRV